MSEINHKVSSYLLIKTISASILGLSTFAGAAYVGGVQFDNIILSILIGFSAGVVAYVAIDMLLGAVMRDLIDPKEKSFLKWLTLIVLLLATGLSTAIVGMFAGEHIGEPKSTDEKQEIRQSVIAQYERRVSDNQFSADQVKKDIRALAYQFKKDTALIIASMPENHQRLYRKGLHARYMTRSGYATLKENVSRIDTRINQYLTDLDSKKSVLSTIESGLAEMRSSDPLEIVNAEILAEDSKNKKFGDMVKGMVWLFDVISVFSLFLSFVFIRSSIKLHPTIKIPENEFHGWVLERLKNLSKKLLESTDGADADLQYFVKSFVKAFSSFAGFVGAMMDLLSRPFTLIKDTVAANEYKGTTNQLQEQTTARQTTTPNGTTNPRHAIGFRQNSGATSATNYSATGNAPTTSQKPATPVGTSVARDLSKTTKTDPVVYSGKSSGMTTSDKKTTNQGATSIRVVNYIGRPHVLHNGVKRDEAWVKKQIRDYTRRLEKYKAQKKDTTTIKGNLDLFDKYLARIDREKKSLI